MVIIFDFGVANLIDGKFKFSRIQAFSTFILPGWEPLDIEKLTNFDFILVFDETAFENWISLSFQDFGMRVESENVSSNLHRKK